MESVLQLLMAGVGILGFILVLGGAGLGMGSAISNASDTSMQGERYERVSKSKTTNLIFKLGISCMFLALLLAMIVKHAF